MVEYLPVFIKKKINKDTKKNLIVVLQVLLKILLKNSITIH